MLIRGDRQFSFTTRPLILHWAPREVLGDHIDKQVAGRTDRLRFDFSHFEGIKSDQLTEIERISNQKLLLNDALEAYEIPFSEKPTRSSPFLEISTVRSSV